MKKYQTGGTTTASMLGQSSSLSPWAGPYVTEMLGKGAALADMPYQPYMGPLTAGASPLQQQAFQGLANLTVPSTITGGGFPTPYQMPMPQQQGMGAQGQADMYGKAGATFDPATKTITTAPGRQVSDGYPMSQQGAGMQQQPFDVTSLGQSLQQLLAEGRGDTFGDSMGMSQAQPLSLPSTTGGPTYANEPFFANKEDYDAWKASQAQPAAGMTPLQYAEAGGLGANVDQRAVQAAQQPQGTSTQQQLASLMNPYLELALQPQYAAAQRQADIAAQNLQSQYGKAGAYGGSRQGVAEAELQRGLLDRMAGITGAGYSTAYDKAADLLGKERSYGLDVLGAQRTAGAEQRAIEGQGIAADIAQFQEERDYPYKQVQYMQSLLQGLPISTQSYQYAEPSTLSNVMGGAGGILGLLETMGVFG